ncbi:putative cytochrome P450 [Melanomma pulvis-pyrius CBS 109.77]|uniref:Putative cytochrome P450 n=1 Tax=Melanomma pulvis-pyrius CBS 109.77 TaxID=1314802 RepID=A0A6A6XX96_9PLEO|nr:putative cytochrome P450 [Melanomma pulvis-pyrius CBS 109.77]
MISTFLRVIQEHWITTLSIAFLTCAVIAIWGGDGAPIDHQHPFVGQGLLWPWLNWSTADRWRLHEYEPVAYERYSKQDKPWYVTYWGLKFLIMPPKYLRDLRILDRNALNLAKALSDALNMEASVGDVPTANTMEIDVVSKHLNSELADTVPLLNDETDYVFSKELGELKEWKQFGAMDLSSKLVHYISNRILVGPDLCRSPEYRAATESLNMSHIIYGALWNFLPLGPFRKPFYWVFSIPYRSQIRRAMHRFIIPIIEQRMAEKDDPNAKRHLDTIQLMVEMPPATPKEVDSFRNSIRILHLHFASTGSTIALVHNCLWQLLQLPETMEPIRAEIKDVLAKYGPWESKHTLNHLHLLDSFIREILRVHVPSAIVSLRLAQQPVTLHDGFVLKRGTRIAFPAQSIHRDPINYDNADEFIPFRFAGSGPCTCESDGLPKDAGRLKADAPDEKYLPFGYGKQSCPGRFFALKVVKLIIGRLIDEYDIKWAKDPPPSPSNGTMEGFFLPANNLQIALRSRSK